METEKIHKTIEGMKTWEVVENQLGKAGLPIPSKPVANVEGADIFKEWDNLRKMYGGVANIPHDELGDFLDRWNSLIAYARWVEAVADIEQATARETRDTIKKQLYMNQDGGRELRDAAVTTDPLYIEWETTYTINLARYIAVKALREGYEYRMASISREITRRGDDINGARRAANVGR